MASPLRICSFNCQGIKNKIPVVGDICELNDIVLLQETWLLPCDFSLVDAIDSSFCIFSLSAVDMGKPLVGRPYGGLSLLWRREISKKCQVLPCNSTRILGLKITTAGRDVIILNVYLPYYSDENFDEYLSCIGEIRSIIEDSASRDIMIIGDFNAKVGGVFTRSGCECVRK